MKFLSLKLTVLVIVINGYQLIAQQKDSIRFFDYYLLVNSPVSRNTKMDIGIERIKLLKNKWYCSTFFSITGGKINGNFNASTVYNPHFLSLCTQPFHLLYGKQLKFETGISTTFRLFRYKNKQYSTTDSLPFFYDELNIIYSIGIRYTLKKSQIGFKLLIGPKYYINLQKKQSYFIDAQSGELGVNWRIRKRVKRVINTGNIN